jgi:two-component system phosphate regulon sensor histidine kinase PhoR
VSFRQKIFVGNLALLLALFVLLFPFVERTVHRLVRLSLEESTSDLIALASSARSCEEAVDILKRQELFVFFRVSLLTEQGAVIYDSLALRKLGDAFQPYFPTTHPEVLEARREGKGYFEGYSQLLGQKFAYVAQTLTIAGRTYILRTAFPFQQIEDLTHNFEYGFLLLSALLLLLFSALTWLIFYRLSRPIQHIIQAIKPYRDGSQARLPHIELRNKKDDFAVLAGTLNSLSERVQEHIQTLLNERNEKEAILESLCEGVIAVDAGMRVTYANFVGSTMMGIPKRHLTGKPFPSSSSKPSLNPLLETCARLLAACQTSQEPITDSLSIGDGKKLYLNLIAAPKAQGEGGIVVLQDNSSHHKVLEMGKDFVANASHELRTPITIIKGFAETLQDLPELSHEMLIDITEKIIRNCHRMDNLVNNLLTLADIENLPPTRFRPCGLISLIENCRHMLLSVYSDAHISIEKNQEEIVVSADADLLELAVMNLLDNAAKYSKPPAQIAVVAELQGDEVSISISDKGIGIPERDLEHVFERFYTVNKAHSRRLGGAGLGLSIVKTIIEKHDGVIAVSSVLGAGTTFTIRLPAR